MRIAHVAPLYESVPPKFYGGTERIIAYLVDGLVDLGHDVTLFASADAETTATLVPVRDQALRLDPHPLKSPIAAHLVDAGRGARPGRRFRHHPFPSQPFPAFPVLRAHAGAHRHDAARTARLRGSRRRLSALAALSDDLDLASPAPAARRGELGRQRSITACRSTSTGRCRGEHEGGGYLAFLGRLSRDKRPDRAIEIARRRGLKLKIAAKVGDDDRAYFHDTIEPLIDGDRDRICRRDRRGGEGRRSSATPRRCCFRSTGRSRSGWSSSRRWPAARRSSPGTRARCPRSSTKA